MEVYYLQFNFRSPKTDWISIYTNKNVIYDHILEEKTQRKI